MANANAKINEPTYSGDLAYPSDLANMDRTGHYVQFFINVQEDAQVNFAAGSFNATPTSQGSRVETEASTISVTRAPTKRLAGTIQLYMPNQLSVGHTATYQEEEIGAMISGMKSASDTWSNSSNWLTGIWNVGAQAVSSAGRGLVNAAASGVGATGDLTGGTGARAALDIKRGEVTNNRTEMRFQGISRREFSFDFKMIPKSQKEAESIKHIVNLFRFHSMPEFIGARSSQVMKAPSTFDIKYMHKGGEHTYMNKISTCTCESVEVKYGGDRTQFFRDNSPSQTEISLKFKEIELVTKERIAEGY